MRGHPGTGISVSATTFFAGADPVRDKDVDNAMPSLRSREVACRAGRCSGLIFAGGARNAWLRRGHAFRQTIQGMPLTVAPAHEILPGPCSVCPASECLRACRPSLRIVACERGGCARIGFRAGRSRRVPVGAAGADVNRLPDQRFGLRRARLRHPCAGCADRRTAARRPLRCRSSHGLTGHLDLADCNSGALNGKWPLTLAAENDFGGFRAAGAAGPFRVRAVPSGRSRASSFCAPFPLRQRRRGWPRPSIRRNTRPNPTRCGTRARSRATPAQGLLCPGVRRRQ